MKKKIFDVIILGTSPICILEAVNRSINGENVMIIEKKNCIGGAWNSLNIFGLQNIENAIHYFLFNKKGLNFLIENLGIQIVESKSKYRIFKISKLGYFHLKYDRIISRLLDKIINNYLSWTLIKNSFVKPKKSYYFKNGSIDLIKKAEKLLFDSKVIVKFNCDVKKIHFNDGMVSLFTENDKSYFESKKVIFTNGSRLKNIYFNKKKIKITEKFQLRPSVHIFVNDSSFQKVKEAIFVKDPLIKYVNEVSSYAKGNLKNKKIFIVALQHKIIETESIYNNILEKLKKARICSPSSTIIETKWSNIYLPTLFNDDLKKLRSLVGEKKLFTLETESFLDAIGTNSKRWKNLK